MKNSFLNSEFNLVKFPIFFPLIYGFILYLFPQFETYLLFFTILLLAETHFGATWPFFLNKANFDLIKKNKMNLITIPIIIVILSVIGFILVKKLFLLIFFAANMFHVTRQSFGVCKLYTNKKIEINFQETFIYSINILFFIIGYFRFYLPVINAENLLLLNIVVLSIILISSIIYIYKFQLSNIYPFLSGVIIFYPICFVNNPVHAIIMGVTMHYTQYLYLTHKVHNGRKKNRSTNNSRYSYLGTIIIYSTLMASLSLFGKSSNEMFNILIMIPIIGQMLHFYLDSQLWKFSNPHNREHVLNYIKN
jgi:hypothetical protein